MEERRTAPRFGSGQTLISRVFTPGSEISQAGWVRNVSAGGMSLLLSRSLEGCSLLFVEIDEPEQVRQYPARLVHCRRQADGTWLIGCQFLSRLEDEEFHRLVTDR